MIGQGRESPKSWFRPRDYGYGARPVTWQGWALIAAYVTAVGLLAAALLGSGRSDPSALLAFFALVVAATIALILVASWKTSGVWRWRWGKEH